jgi:hypothetical protein
MNLINFLGVILGIWFIFLFTLSIITIVNYLL